MKHPAISFDAEACIGCGLCSRVCVAHNFAIRQNQASTVLDTCILFNAPIAIVILSENRTNGILAAQNMEFVAEANGLGVLYSGFFTMAANASRKIRRSMGVPKGRRVAMTLVLGYPDVRFFAFDAPQGAGRAIYVMRLTHEMRRADGAFRGNYGSAAMEEE